MSALLASIGLAHVLAFAPASAPALAAPPADDAVRQAIDRYVAAREKMYTTREVDEETERILAAPLGDLAVDEMTPRQLAMLHGAGLVSEGAQRDAAILRLAGFPAEDESVDGAVVAVLRLAVHGAVRYEQVNGEWKEVRPETEQQVKLLRAALRHPRLADAVRAGDALQIVAAVQEVSSKEAWSACREEVLGLRRLFTPDAPPALFLSGEGCFELLQDVAGDDRTVVQEARAAIVRGAERALAKHEAARAEGGTDGGAFTDREAEWLRGQVAFMNGAAARGELLDHPAPALTFRWSSDEALDAMADLAGRVVVLDFWATWCGPCVASFPKVKELQARYEGYPVTIVGVTSIQGMVVSPEGRIDCKGDPEREFAEMAKYVAAKEITWPVVFTQEDVFNPDFGVRGIPHVAIIDPAGRVRHNDLHPAAPLREKMEKINALLAQAGLPAPVIPEDEAAGSGPDGH